MLLLIWVTPHVIETGAKLSFERQNSKVILYEQRTGYSMLSEYIFNTSSVNLLDLREREGSACVTQTISLVKWSNENSFSK